MDKTITKRTFIKKCLAVSTGAICFSRLAEGYGFDRDEQDIYSKLAMYQEETPRGIMCRICPNECVLKEGELSKCNNRKVIRSKEHSLHWDWPSFCADL